jgi:hypothetical protein
MGARGLGVHDRSRNVAWRDNQPCTGYLRDHVGAKLSFGEIDINKTYVREARDQFGAVVAAFPTR